MRDAMKSEWLRWPTMEEEILIIENTDHVFFNLPYRLYEEGLREHLKELGVEKVESTDDPLGGRRIIIVLDKQSALELKAWITIQVSKNSSRYFVTDLEEI